MTPDDSNFLHAAEIPSWITDEFGLPGPDGTWGGMGLEDMIHDFSPAVEAEEDDDDCGPAASDWAGMRREYGTWSV